MKTSFQTSFFKIVPGLAFSLVICWPAHAPAWGPDAHRIVGMIADRNLVLEVRNKIRQDFNITSLANVANWADHVRDQRSQGRWHYANVREGERAYVRERDCPQGDCVVEKVREFSKALSEDSLRHERIESVKYLVHLVADLHQPLHLGNKKDRGGNKIQIVHRGETTNLHALWDSGLVYSAGENLLQYAHRLDRRVSKDNRLLWTRSGVVDWANESREQALDLAYDRQVTATGILNKTYIRKARDTLELRLSQAGVRLAHLLNTLLK
ncbi:hypothetical protein UZ36_02010 [Candidatus Nitromaritima sp. SCGC AAA799-C22]|nr:hypothetical protein UZ36_02010 [Candidatus Nitromaritima sp. SCGC AAA799-C22]